MKSRLFKSVLVICVLVFGFSVIGAAKHIWVRVPHFNQERINWCGVACVKMWEHFIKGWSHTEYQIAPWRMIYFQNQGLNGGQLRNLLQKYTGRRFDLNDHTKKKHCRKRIYKELRRQRRPLVIAGTSRPKNRNPRPGGHWMLIFAGEIKGKGSNYHHPYVKIMDPLYNSPFAWRYHVLRPNFEVKERVLFNTIWRPFRNTNGLRQSIDD